MEKRQYRFEVTAQDRGKRLDRFLVEKLSDRFSRSFIQRLILNRHVSFKGSSAKAHQKVSEGDVIEIDIPEAVPFDMKGEDIPLDIVYEDEYLLVVNKRAGMVVHPAPGNFSGTLVNALIWHCKDLSGISGVMKPGIVHRIDKGTSGLLVVAKTDEAHRALAKQFKNKETNRVYVAFVKGVMELDNGIIDLPIGRSSRDRKKMAVDHSSDKNAVTRYKVLERFKDFTVLELKLGTGRTHQIRVHMSYLGYPLLGDETYGTKGIFPRPALHAKMLGFIHPATKKYMEFSSNLPEDMRDYLEKARV
ncbi:MAG: RluA family pseudouridine synthase [Candidatus Omnitrophica bacterium]|nr:RluA family pseudouridine synthase [Candidatus Omnitrophota bacterium]